MSVLHPCEIDGCAALAVGLAEGAIAALAGVEVEPSDASTKSGPGDWVTAHDVAVEGEARRRISAAFPAHRLVGEELGRSGRAGDAPVWFVDPIDGTTNFVHGIPWSSFSVAVADELGLAAGAVGDLSRHVVYSTRRSAGAWRGRTVLRCTASTRLEGGIVLTELAGTVAWPGLAAMIAALGDRHCVTRLMGSSALALAMVAAGAADAAVLACFDPIDVAAGVLLAREAGAEVSVPAGAAPELAAGPGRGRPVAGPRAVKRQLEPAAQLLVAAAPGVRNELHELLGAPAS